MNAVRRQTMMYGCAVAIGIVLGLPVAAEPVSPEGMWDIDGIATLQIYRCGELFCGRVRGLTPVNPNAQRPYTDIHNPNPTMRQRRICGLTIMGGLRPSETDRWEDGWFYNPEDGISYRVSAHLRARDELVARFYLGVKLLGKSKIGRRLTNGVIRGSC